MMRSYLLDTMVVLWMSFEPERLGKEAVRVIKSKRSLLHYSVVSFWEIGIKMGLSGYGDMKLPHNWDELIPEYLEGMGIKRITLDPTHCRLIQDLPQHHKDPFDRMLVAQAIDGRLSAVSSDEMFERYGVQRVW